MGQTTKWIQIFPEETFQIPAACLNETVGWSFQYAYKSFKLCRDSPTHPIVLNDVGIPLHDLQGAVVGDAPPKDDGVLHEREEDQHHAGQQPDLHGSDGVRDGYPCSTDCHIRLCSW